VCLRKERLLFIVFSVRFYEKKKHKITYPPLRFSLDFVKASGGFEPATTALPKNNERGNFPLFYITPRLYDASFTEIRTLLPSFCDTFLSNGDGWERFEAPKFRGLKYRLWGR